MSKRMYPLFTAVHKATPIAPPTGCGIRPVPNRNLVDTMRNMGGPAADATSECTPGPPYGTERNGTGLTERSFRNSKCTCLYFPGACCRNILLVAWSHYLHNRDSYRGGGGGGGGGALGFPTPRNL